MNKGRRRPRRSKTRAESIRRSWLVATIAKARRDGIRAYHARARRALAALDADRGVAGT
jgi:hypothetical protein